jgi:hypothetical protein
MSNNEMLSSIKYVSAMKPEFMLSEIVDYLQVRKEIKEIYEAVLPSLFDMGLKATKAGPDFRITRLPPSEKSSVTQEQKDIVDKHLSSFTLSKKLQESVERYIEKKVSKKWDDPAILERIRKGILVQKAQYWKQSPAKKVDYDSGYAVLGYLAYQMPVYVAGSEHILYQMAIDGVLKTRMKVLDVGTGVGSVPLALSEIGSMTGIYSKVYSIEKYDENIEAYMALVPEHAGDSADILRPIKADVTELDLGTLPSGFDLIVFSNVLNELELTLEKKVELVKNISSRLAEDGSILIVEPADKKNSMQMRDLVIALMDKGVNVYAPCTFMWGGCCRPRSCWSFEQKKDIKPTALMQKLAECEESYRYVNTDLKYSYAILRTDKVTRESYRVPHKAKFARMSKLAQHVEKRINIVASVMSGDLGDTKIHMFKICDGTCTKPVYAVLPAYHKSDDNNALLEAGYGDVLEFENVLVRFNKERDAYNLLLGKTTIITKAGGGE